MSRFPPIPPSELSPEQKVLHDEIDIGTQKEFGKSFQMKNSEGALLGPMAPLLYTPSLGSSWFGLNRDIITLTKTTISLRERELAIFAVLAYSPAPYALYAHTLIAEKVGFSPTQVANAKEGKMPKDLSEREEATYVLAGELVRMRGPLGEEAFERARKVLGREGVAAITHTTGAFLYSSFLLNVADVPAPSAENV